MLEEINNLKRPTVITVVAFLNATITPGILVIYHFKPEIFYGLDDFKLVLLALSFTLPLLGFHNVLGSFAIKPNKSLKAGADFVFGAFMLGLNFFVTLTWAYLCSLSLRQFVYAFIFAEIIFVILCYLTHRKSEKENY